MGRKFHINKYGVPAICNSLVAICPYGNERHFKSYEDAKAYADMMNDEIVTGIPMDKSDPAKKIKSYFYSRSAVNEFPINRRVAELENFELVIISWMTKRNTESEMKYNKIGDAKFTYGDIVRVLNEEVKREFNEGINLEKYYNPIPYDVWENPMKIQRNLYKNTTHILSKELGFESMEVISLPLSARRRLSYDGFLLDPEDIHEVIYKVHPAVSRLGNVISYSHNTREISREFDFYELAGVVEGKTLHDFCYSENIQDKFQSIWAKSRLSKQGEIDYNKAMERYRRQQFLRGIEGTDVPKAFIRMSPIVAQEVANFVKNYKAIMFAVEDILNEQGLADIEYEYEYESGDDDGDWVIE